MSATVARRIAISESGSAIEPGVHQVHREVDEDEDERHEHHQRLRQRVVAAGDGLDEEIPRPFRLNTCSVTTSPPMRNANSSAITVSTAHGVFQGVTRQDELQPEAPWRAPCGCSPRSTSSMAERVIRVATRVAVADARAGQMSWSMSATGSQNGVYTIAAAT